jgi:Zn-dependent peptidase ImmA (M78 family)
MSYTNIKLFEEAKDVATTLFRKHSLFSSGHDFLKYRCDALLVDLAIKYKIHIESHQFKKSKKFSGMLIIDELETTIVYNSEHSPERRNFTLGHELGHYFLHRDKASQFLDRLDTMLENTIDHFEVQANAFSAYLLLPDDVLVLMISYRFSFFRIALTTRVSYECLKWRLVNYLNDEYNFTSSESNHFINEYYELSKSKSHSFSALFELNESNKYRLLDKFKSQQSNNVILF